MIETGRIKRLQILGGFLADLDLEFDDHLNCVIGARGTGKTTLLEALRFGLCRSAEELSSEAVKLLRENLQIHPIKIDFEFDSSPGTYTITRFFGGEVSCVGPTGNKLDSFPNFPLSVFSTDEIEEIANDPDGTRKRKLLDDFEPEQLRERRNNCDRIIGQLKKNATETLVLEAEAEPLLDVVRELPQLAEKVTGLVSATERMSTDELKVEHSLYSLRRKETAFANSIRESLDEIQDSLAGEIKAIEQTNSELLGSKPDSEVNAEVLNRLVAETSHLFESASAALRGLSDQISSQTKVINKVISSLNSAHKEQEARYEKLRESNLAMSAKLREKEEAQELFEKKKRAAIRLDEINSTLMEFRQARAELLRMLEDERDAISSIRETVAANITRGSVEDTGSGAPPVIDVRIIRRGDRTYFKSLLQNALQGSKLRYSQMVDLFSARCLPAEFAALVRQKNGQRLGEIAEVDVTRTDSLVQHLNNQPEFLYELDSLIVDDKVEIQLNVADANSDAPEYKEAADLSTGQKCTAILPIILLATSSGPLLIDQPENNLDNHYIFTDVVPRLEAIKGIRQLIFITHNPNIPVLAEAERVAVLKTETTDEGVRGRLHNVGTVDDVREEIISLLEGGREAFQLRAQKYGPR